MKKGFTLAEVLTTLMVIGVVAALTIPSMMNSYKERETVSKVLKAYSTLANAYKLTEAEDGTPMDWFASGYGYNNFINHLNTIKVCKTAEETDCFAKGQEENIQGWLDWCEWAFGQRPSALLNDGSSLIMWHHDPTNCKAGSEQILCSVIFYDINGPDKGPNKWGRDVFAFEITQKGIRAEITYDNSPVCTLNPSEYSHPRNGAACTDYIVKNRNMKYLHEKFE